MRALYQDPNDILTITGNNRINRNGKVSRMDSHVDIYSELNVVFNDDFGFFDSRGVNRKLWRKANWYMMRSNKRGKVNG